MPEFICLSLIAAIFISLTCSMLGNFMVWKRISFLGDAIGHSSLLGIAVGVLFHNVNYLWIFLVCIIFAVTLVLLKHISSFNLEALLVFNVQLFLSVGLVIIGWFYISDGTTGISYLFGDLFLLTPGSVTILGCLAVGLAIYITMFWRSLIVITVNTELAYSEGIKVLFNEILFMAMLSANVAFLVRYVGVMLVPSLLIIPALLGNYICQTVRGCFTVAALCNYVGIAAGLALSFVVDIPVTPLITLVIAASFILTISFRFIVCLCRKN